MTVWECNETETDPGRKKVAERKEKQWEVKAKSEDLVESYYSEAEEDIHAEYERPCLRSQTT